MCDCNLCKARELNKHPWQIMWGLDSLKSKLLDLNPNLAIYEYEWFVALRYSRAFPCSPLPRPDWNTDEEAIRIFKSLYCSDSPEYQQRVIDEEEYRKALTFEEEELQEAIRDTICILGPIKQRTLTEERALLMAHHLNGST